MFYVVDNFLPEDYFKKIQDLVVYNKNFPWFLNKGKVIEDDGDYQFTHILVNYKKINSQLYDNFVPVFEKINPKEIVRAKFNLTPKTSNHQVSIPHVDCDEEDIKACVLYLNTNNGFTYFGEEKVFSVENRIVFFNANHEHGGSTCTDSNVRVVLNIIYF